MNPPLKDSPNFAAFIDLASVPPERQDTILERLTRADSIGPSVDRAIVHGATRPVSLPAGWSHAGDVSDVLACAWSFDAAADADRDLLILGAGAAPAAESIAALAQGLALDPLFGVALPRLSEASGRLLLPEIFGPSSVTAPLRILARLPDYQVLSERLSPCMLVRREVVGNFRFRALPGNGMWQALGDLVIRMRRAGFRPLMCNRVVVPLMSDGPARWGCSDQETNDLQRRHSEPSRPPAPRARHAERLLAAAFDSPQSLVVDARNLTPTFNGTSAAILGACDALHRAQSDEAVSLWLHPDAAASYRVLDRFPGWNVCTMTPERSYAAALRLSQPWHPADLDSLRDVAAVNVYWMLDNIAWDIGYAAPAGLDATWQRLAAEADGLLFISDFSRQRFMNRFTCDPGVHLQACPLSLEPADYAPEVTDGGPQPPYWLVVGNRYDHKHVAPTVDLLARSFPLQNLVVFGDRDQPRSSRVTRFASGRVDYQTVRACYARADVVVFPSFYEGFGLPMIEGLAYGRTVVARQSCLVSELAQRYRGPGRLFVYSTERELVEILGRLTRGEEFAGVPLVTRDASKVWNWDTAAACMLSAVSELIAQAPSVQMLKRTGLARGLSASAR